MRLAQAADEATARVDEDRQALPAPYQVADASIVAEDTQILRILRCYASASGLLIASCNWLLGGDRYIHRTRIMLDRE